MNDIRHFLRIFIVSLVLAVIATLACDMLNFYSMTYDFREDELQTIDKMSYKDGVEYIRTHSRPMSGFEYLKRNLKNYKNPLLWKRKSSTMALFFMTVFIGCLWISCWHKYK